MFVFSGFVGEKEIAKLARPHWICPLSALKSLSGGLSVDR